MMKRITIDLHPIAAIVTAGLAAVAGQACDYVLQHPEAIPALAHRVGVGPVVTAVVTTVVIPGLLPKAAAWCRAQAGDGPAPASPEATAINATMTASDAGPEVPAFQPDVHVPLASPPNTDAASAARATSTLPPDQQGM